MRPKQIILLLGQDLFQGCLFNNRLIHEGRHVLDLLNLVISAYLSNLPHVMAHGFLRYMLPLSFPWLVVL